MGGESPKPASTSTGAVFLSYASQDAEAAQKICDALCAAGIEVWFDRSELRGGEAWDRQITKQIRECSLFVAVVSSHTDERSEGYFRREWRAAVERMRDMADDRSFLVPVAIDSTREDSARVPDRFREFQWIRLPKGETPPAAVERIQRLLSTTTALKPSHEPGGVQNRPETARDKGASPDRHKPRWLSPALVLLALLLLAGGIYFALDRFVLSKHYASISPVAGEKSIAVLPFVDMSEKHDEEYFADGMAEEVLNLLAQVPALRVPGRTSSFYFKGKQATLAEIAKTLGVAHVLEGSVRRAGTTIRVTVQLIRADNGYHLWSKSYDRDLQDVLKVQDDIAQSVVGALKVSLLGTQPPRAAPTVDPEAYRLYLAAHALRVGGRGGTQQGIDYLRTAIKLDPTFALAHAELAATIAGDFASTGVLLYPTALAEAHAGADEAIRLDPQLPLAHIALARLFFQVAWNWDAGEAEISKALALEPGNAEANRMVGYFATTRGQFDEAIELLKKAASLDPLQAWNYIAMGFPVYRKHDYAQAEALYRKAIGLNHQTYKVHYVLGTALLMHGRPAEALAEMEQEPDAGYRHCGLALAFDALGRKREADSELAIAEANHANEKAYWIALVYAVRRDEDSAFRWLDRAAKQKDPGMLWIRGEPMLDALAKDPRYETLLRRINLL